MRGSSGLPKISRVGFETIDIFKNCTGSANTSTDSTIGAVPITSVSPVISIGSSDSVGRSVGSADGVESVEMAFEFSENINDENRKILIIFPIFSSSKSSSINLPDSIVSSFRTSIVIIISFRESSKSFRLKNLSLLKTIFFSNRTS